ncbi:MAG: ABC transporter substrate-binding protein [Bilophila wadsworthia]
MAPDGLSLTLHLVKGAKFHDGTPITSEDVAFSIMAIKASHPFKAMYAPIRRGYARSVHRSHPAFQSRIPPSCCACPRCCA